MKNIKHISLVVLQDIQSYSNTSIDIFKTSIQNNQKCTIRDMLSYRGYIARVTGVIPMRTLYWGFIHIVDHILNQSVINIIIINIRLLS